ncbi:MAG: hypothetical protein WKG07_30965 [Hymenobacter sp.]
MAESYGYLAVRTRLPSSSTGGPARRWPLGYWLLTVGLWALASGPARTRHDRQRCRSKPTCMSRCRCCCWRLSWWSCFRCCSKT